MEFSGLGDEGGMQPARLPITGNHAARLDGLDNSPRLRTRTEIIAEAGPGSGSVAGLYMVFATVSAAPSPGFYGIFCTANQATNWGL